MPSENIFSYLSQNSYPGRGILLGRSRCGSQAVIAYFIMGRSENSRNRVFEETNDGIRTRAFDEQKLSDPSLVIYHPVRRLSGRTIVTNGDQTDTIRDYLLAGKSFEDALRTRCFEPDGPLFTPRISGLVERDGSFSLSILKSDNGDERQCLRYFYQYPSPLSGQGRLIHTYKRDGAPPPSFKGEPVEVSLDTEGDIRLFAQRLWEALNEQNRISLFVSFTDIGTGQREQVIINKHQ